MSPNEETFYVLICRPCNKPPNRFLTIPFGSAESRGKWAAAHTRATGHDSWLVVDEVRPVSGLSQDATR